MDISLRQDKVMGFSENRMINQSDEAKSNILHLEAEMSKIEGAKDKEIIAKNYPINHHFAPGVYAREIHLPAGHVVVGKIHKHAHLNIISKGMVLVSTEAGTEELTGPCIFTSYAGTKRAVLILKDTIWTTIHVTQETDLEKIEDELIAKRYEELEEVKS